MTPIRTAATCVLLGLTAACGGSGGSGGGGGGGGAFDPQAELQNLAGVNPSATLQRNLPSGRAQYNGVGSFNFSDPQNAQLIGYYGDLTIDVDFASGNLSGEVDRLVDFQRNAVSGRVDIGNGRLSGENTAGIGGGLSARATGRIDGEPLSMEVTGNVIGDNGEGLALYFADDDTNRIGTGLAAR